MFWLLPGLTHYGSYIYWARGNCQRFSDLNMVKIINISIMFYVIIFDKSTIHVQTLQKTQIHCDDMLTNLILLGKYTVECTM